MVRHDEQGWWEWEATGLVDDDGEEVGEYKLVGSMPLSFYELMILRAEGVSGGIDLEMEWLR
jgi:hypothetical protein